jgi:DNA-binding transcriptional LysR family regulator
MNINTVKYFLTVCEQRNFTKAAGVIGISQPSLSLAIQRLERELGGVLFYRDGLGVRLTELARDLRPSFRAISRHADRVISRAHAPNKLTDGPSLLAMK